MPPQFPVSPIGGEGRGQGATSGASPSPTSPSDCPSRREQRSRLSGRRIEDAPSMALSLSPLTGGEGNLATLWLLRRRARLGAPSGELVPAVGFHEFGPAAIEIAHRLLARLHLGDVDDLAGDAYS